MSKPRIEGQFYTTRTAARALGVSLRCIQLWCTQGRLRHCITPGGHRRIYPESVNKFLLDMKDKGCAISTDIPDHQPEDIPYWLRKELSADIDHYDILPIPRVELSCIQLDEARRGYSLTAFGSDNNPLANKHAITLKIGADPINLHILVRLNSSVITFTTEVRYATAGSNELPDMSVIKHNPIRTYLLDLA